MFVLQLLHTRNIRNTEDAEGAEKTCSAMQVFLCLCDRCVLGVARVKGNSEQLVDISGTRRCLPLPQFTRQSGRIKMCIKVWP